MSLPVNNHQPTKWETGKNIAIGGGVLLFGKLTGVFDAVSYLFSKSEATDNTAALLEQLKSAQDTTAKTASEATAKFNELAQKATEATNAKTLAETSKAALEEAAKKAAEELSGHTDALNKQTQALNTINARCKTLVEEAAKKTCTTDASDANVILEQLRKQNAPLTGQSAAAQQALKDATSELTAKAESAAAAEAAAATAKTAAETAFEEAKTAANKYAEEASKHTYLAKIKEAGSNTIEGLKARVEDAKTTSKSWLAENGAWLGQMTGFVATYYVVDHLASNKIKNLYARKAFSFATAVVAVWTASNYGFKHDLQITNAVTNAALAIGAVVVTKKYLAPSSSYASAKFYHFSNWAGDRKVATTREKDA